MTMNEPMAIPPYDDQKSLSVPLVDLVRGVEVKREFRCSICNKIRTVTGIDSVDGPYHWRVIAFGALHALEKPPAWSMMCDQCAGDLETWMMDRRKILSEDTIDTGVKVEPK